MEQSEYQSSHRISMLTKEVEAAEASKAIHNAEKEALQNEVRHQSCGAALKTLHFISFSAF
jgi:hypothetical protein